MRRFKKLLMVMFASLAVVGCQSAGSTANLSPIALTPAALPVSSAMPAGLADAEKPPGFASFCLRFAAQCQNTPEAPATLTLDAPLLAKMADINRSVNRQIWPKDDIKHYGRAEYWTIPTDGYGDCDDYALTKRAQLIAAGLPASTLRLAIAITPRNMRHTVLTVATDRGDYILDSLYDEIRPWNAESYRWVMRQKSDARSWDNLQPDLDGVNLALSTIPTAAIERANN